MSIDCAYEDLMFVIDSSSKRTLSDPFVCTTGYYRVNYDEGNWLKIAEYLNSEDYAKIHYLNRAQLIDDAYYFTMRGEMKYTTFMELIKYLERETNFVPWYSMMNVLHYMSPFFQFPESQEFKVCTLRGKMSQKIKHTIRRV